MPIWERAPLSSVDRHFLSKSIAKVLERGKSSIKHGGVLQWKGEVTDMMLTRGPR